MYGSDAGDQDGASAKWSSHGFSHDRPVRLLVVGDDDEFEPTLRTLVGRLRLSANVEAAFVKNVADAQRALRSTDIDVLVSELHLRDGTSDDLFHALDELSLDTARIAVAGEGEALDTLHVGAAAGEVWVKTQPTRELRERLERLIERRALAHDGGSRS